MDRPFCNAIVMDFIKCSYVFLLVISFLSCKSDGSITTQLITTHEFEIISQIQGIQLVDVRTPGEYEAGHILNAININFSDPSFELNIQKLDKKSPVIVYCQRGGRSAKSAVKLRSNSFVKVYDLEGGFSKWVSNESSKNK